MNKVFGVGSALSFFGAWLAYDSGQGIGATLFLAFIGTILLILFFGVRP